MIGWDEEPQDRYANHAFLMRRHAYHTTIGTLLNSYVLVSAAKFAIAGESKKYLPLNTQKTLTRFDVYSDRSFEGGPWCVWN